MRLATTLLLCLAALACPAWSQPGLPPGVRGPAEGLATRSVSDYLRQERSLEDALLQEDRDAVRQQLADDFTAYTPTANDEGLSAEAWLTGELRHPPSDAEVRDLNVRDLGELAVVSFLLDQQYQRNWKTTSTTLYVVDVWRQAPRQLLARYVSRPARIAPAPAKPSGKE